MVAETPPVEQPEAKPPKMGAAPIAVLTVGGVGVASGVAFSVLSGQARRDWQQHCGDGDNARLCRSEADPGVRRDKLFGAVADASWAVGAVGIGTGIALAVLDKKKRAQGVAITGGPGSLWVVGTF